MATSIYIFENYAYFEKVYADKIKELEYKVDLVDLWVKKDKLWIVTNTNDMKEQPRLSSTLVHFRRGTIDEWKEGDEKLVLHDKLRFSMKHNRLEFFPRFLRKPLLWLRVGRYYGDTYKKHMKLDYSKRYYDFSNDRIIFICEEKDGRN